MNYGRKKIAKKQKNITSKSTMQKKKVGVRLFKALLMCLLVMLVIGAAGGAMFVKRIIDNAPEITPASVKPSKYMTTVYADDGKTVTEQFLAAGSNRVYRTLDEIPIDLQHAFVAIEDSRFYEHNGVDIKGIARAGVKAVTGGSLSEGASTITQQLLKNSVFNFMEEKTTYQKVERKLQEQFLAIELEKQMSKEEILEDYLNMINLGQNTLGVQMASQRYFNKDVSELTLSECAVIAGITKNPGGYNPVTNPADNRRRQEKVLKDMCSQGYISQQQVDEALADDVYARIKNVNEEIKDDTPYSYFNDALAEQLLKDFVKMGYTEAQAYNAVYSGGLTVYSTQNLKIQKICDQEVNDDDNYISTKRWGLSYVATVTHADGTTTNYSSGHIKAFAKKKYNDKQGLLYSSKDAAKKVIKKWKKTVNKKGDVWDEKITLSPQPQSSVSIIDQKTGEIKAMVGGRGKKASSMSLNRAYTGSKRQPGSTFKVLASFAPALDVGDVTLSTTMRDEPYTYKNGKPVKNWYRGGYRGTVTIRKAIEQSMNIIAVKTITEITPELGYEYLEKFGFTTLIDKKVINGKVYSDIGQPLALGGVTDGVYNYELCAAFASIANEGVYNEPVLYSKVLDHDGNPLLDNTQNPKSHKALKKDTAALLTDAMQDVVKYGTGKEVNLGSMPVAGKTGTTSADKDVWFCGYTPYYTCAVWVGYDDNKSMTGETHTHLRLWRSIMSRIHENLDPKEFDMPKGMERVTVCTITGLRATSSCPTRTEYFTSDTVPTDYCSGHYVPKKETKTENDNNTDDNNNNNDNQDGGTPTPTPTPKPKPDPTPDPDPTPPPTPEDGGTQQ